MILYHYYATSKKGDNLRQLDGTFELESPMIDHEDYENVKEAILETGDPLSPGDQLTIKSLTIISGQG